MLSTFFDKLKIDGGLRFNLAASGLFFYFYNELATYTLHVTGAVRVATPQEMAALAPASTAGCRATAETAATEGHHATGDGSDGIVATRRR